jgi:DNA repair exonuclease SbcCD nuclease subunit
MTILPTAILTADWHLRDSVPVCRIDDFWQTQWRKVEFVAKLALKYNCPVLHAGDLFDNWKPSPYLLSMALMYLPDNFYTVYGNHDLPQHSLKEREKSGIHTLEKAGKIHVLPNGHWGEELDPTVILFENNPSFEKIAVWHKFTYGSVLPWPGCKEVSAFSLLRKNPYFRLIVTGDNHTPCVVRLKDRVLVNPGSLMRQTADQLDHTPRVYLWYSNTNEIKKVMVPIDVSAVIRTHLDDVAKKDERIQAFISKLQEKWDVTLSFEENMKTFLFTHRLKKQVVELIHAAMDHTE